MDTVITHKLINFMIDSDKPTFKGKPSVCLVTCGVNLQRKFNRKSKKFTINVGQKTNEKEKLSYNICTRSS